MATLAAEPAVLVIPLREPPTPGGSVAEALRYGREHDWVGHHIATALALIHMFLLPLATAPKDWAFGLLVLWSVIRLPHTWRSYTAFVRMPVFWTTLAWALWVALSLLWSENPKQGLDEFKAQRMLILPLLLWPILDRAPWLVMAALGGVLAQNGVQAMQDLGWLSVKTGGESRLPGLIHSIHSAMWFAAAMVWHLSASLQTWRWRRWISLGLLLIAGAGLVATGSRGPWIAAVIALPAALIVIPLRQPAARRAALGLAAAAILGIAVTAGLGHRMIQTRLGEARQEITQARQQHIYWTSAGLRLGLWAWAIEIWQSHPIVGVGVGSFARYCQRLDSFQRACDVAAQQSAVEAEANGTDMNRPRGQREVKRLTEAHIHYMQRDHAHSTYLHTLASEGVIGLGLLLSVLAVIAQQCWRDRMDHPYAAGMFFALLCWIIGAQFDCYELNGHQLGLLTFIAALTLPGRPPVRWRLSAIDE